jgi:hypothetical protein
MVYGVTGAGLTLASKTSISRSPQWRKGAPPIQWCLLCQGAVLTVAEGYDLASEPLFCFALRGALHHSNGHLVY